MKWTHTLAPLLLALAANEARPSDLPEGRIETDSGSAEVLSKKLPIGKRIELPEGWYEVEEEGVEDQQVGSFTVEPANGGDQQAPPVAPPAEPPPTGG